MVAKWLETLVNMVWSLATCCEFATRLHIVDSGICALLMVAFFSIVRTDYISRIERHQPIGLLLDHTVSLMPRNH